MDIDGLQQWVGREETVEDLSAAATVKRLAALLDHDQPPWRDGEVPSLGHWLYFLPSARQSEIDSDGHPKRGGFLPPVPLSRRMWAGGRLTFHTPIQLGATIRRRSVIREVTHKKGSTGDLVFVLVGHETLCGGTVCIVEEQDIVYRGGGRKGAASKPVKAKPETRSADRERTLVVDPTQLFRYSALTFNAHRIHYDRDYAREVEGYPGLVVHGPFQATLLMDHFLCANPGARISGFSFRSVKPLFDGAPFTLCLKEVEKGADLWIVDSDGEATMTASVEVD